MTTTTQTQKITQKIEDYLNRYVFFTDPAQSLICALWVLHSWTFHGEFPSQPWTTGYLYVNGPKGSGKTLLIDLLEPLCLNSERAVDMSAATMFRLIDMVRPTLFIDEVDTWVRDETRRGVVNGGYKHGGYVWRTAPSADGPEPTKFFTFCAKLLAGIDNGQLPDTIQSRSIPINMRRITGGAEKRERYFSFKAGPIAAELVEEVSKWVLDRGTKISDYEPAEGEFENREFEIAYPLLQIAHADGREREAREGLLRLIRSHQEKEDEGVRILRAIKELFDERQTDRLDSNSILDHLKIPHGKILGTKLRPYDIGGSRPFTMGNRQVKGYYRHQFEDAWGRYL